MQSEISGNIIQLLHGKNCLLQLCFFRIFSTVNKPSRRSNTAARKKMRKGKKEKRKGGQKYIKSKKPKDLGHFLVKKLHIQIWIFVHV